jgi:hypothetical protein
VYAPRPQQPLPVLCTALCCVWRRAPGVWRVVGVCRGSARRGPPREVSRCPCGCRGTPSTSDARKEPPAKKRRSAGNSERGLTPVAKQRRQTSNGAPDAPLFAGVDAADAGEPWSLPRSLDGAASNGTLPRTYGHRSRLRLSAPPVLEATPGSSSARDSSEEDVADTDHAAEEEELVIAEGSVDPLPLSSWRFCSAVTPLAPTELVEIGQLRSAAPAALTDMLNGGAVTELLVDEVLAAACAAVPGARAFPAAEVRECQLGRSLPAGAGSLFLLPFAVGGHWRLCVADGATRAVELLDPMLGTGAARTGPAIARSVASLLEAGAEGGLGWRVTLRGSASVPQRACKADTGMCVLYFALCRLTGSPIRPDLVETPAGVPRLRQCLFLDMVRHDMSPKNSNERAELSPSGNPYE